MIIIDCDQNSTKWYLERLGKPTSSKFSDVVKMNGTQSKSRDKYMRVLAGEIITGKTTKGFYGKSMKEGHEREQESRQLYEFINKAEVKQVGFCFFDDKKEFGSSTDGLIGDEGVFETKNAEPHIQISRIEDGWPKREHFQQVQGELYVTGRKWCDLVSYSRGFKPIVIRFSRDEKFIEKLAEEIQIFIKDLKELVTRLKA